MNKHILVTEVKGKKYSTTLYNVLRIFADKVVYTIQFTDNQEDYFVPKTEFVSFGIEEGGC